MRSITLCAALVLSACTTPDVNNSYEYDVDINVELPETDDTGAPVDDTGLDDTGDTAEVDECTEEECCFSLTDAATGSEVELSNALTVTPDWNQDQNSEPARQSVLHFNQVSGFESCEPLTIREFTLQVDSNVDPQTSWLWELESSFDLYSYTNQRGGSPAHLVAIPQGGGLVKMVGELFVEPGDSMYSYMMADAFGMSDGDWIQVTLLADSMVVDDGVNIATIPNPEIEGGTITFSVPEPEPVPCSDPRMEVFGDSDITLFTRGGEARLGRFHFAAISESAYLTHLTVTLEGDNDTSTHEFDHQSDPQDHIMSCELRSANGVLYGLEAPEHDNTVIFEDLDDFFIYRNTVEELEIWCQFNTLMPNDDDNDSFSAYIASVDDMVFEDLDANALTTENVCLPFGLPNEDSDTWAEMFDNGALLTAWNGPLAGTMLPGTEDHKMLDFWMTSLYEDLEVDDLTVFFDGDYQIIESVGLRFQNQDGDWGTKWITLDNTTPNTAYFRNLGSYGLVLEDHGSWQTFEVLVNIDPLAEPGQSITATLATWGLSAYGLDSGGQLTLQDMTPSSDIVGNPQTVEAPCSFETELANGSTVWMDSQVTLSLSSNSPEGTGFVPSMMEGLRFNASANPCEDVELQGFDLSIMSYDYDNSGWADSVEVKVYNLSTIGFTSPVGTSTLINGQGSIEFENLYIPAASTYTFAIYVDTTGASMIHDDSFQLAIMENSVDWSDWTTDAVDLVLPGLPGFWISF